MARLRTWWLAGAIFVVGAAFLISSPARADDEGKGEPVRVKKKVKLRGGTEAKPARNPMDTAHKWLMKELSRHMAAMADAEGEAAKSPLHYWFATKDVPLAGLRDALKADGWTADELMEWVHKHLLQSMLQMGQTGNVMGLDFGEMLHGLNPGAGPRWRGRMPRFGGLGPAQGGRTIIIWSDGTGWRRQDLPGQEAPKPWFGGFRRGPGAGKGAQGIEQLIEMLRRLQKGAAGGKMQPPPVPPKPPRPPVPPRGPKGGAHDEAMDAVLDLLRRLQGGDSDDAGRQNTEALRKWIEEMVKSAQAGRGADEADQARVQELIRQFLRGLQPAEPPAPPPAPKKPKKAEKAEKALK